MEINFNNPIVNLTLKTGLVYGIAYAGRAYLQINPLHAALFALGTFVANELGKSLAEKITEERYSTTFAGRMIKFVASYTPALVTIGFGLLSPLQTVTAIGLTFLSDDAYFAIIGRHQPSLR